MAKTAQVQMLRAVAANDCHQMKYLAIRSTARILIGNLRHRHGLLLTRPAVSSRGGETRHERAAEIEPIINGHQRMQFTSLIHREHVG